MNIHLVTSIVFALFLTSCESARSSSSETLAVYAIERAGDAAKVASLSPNPSFLVWNGGALEPSWIPGLTQEEVENYVTSGRYGTVVFHSYHLDFHTKGSEVDRLINAKYKYAEEHNRILLRLLKVREPQSK